MSYHAGAETPSMNRNNSPQERFKLFAEQWVLARAQHFRVGHEEEDAFSAVLAARSIYNNLVIQSESPALIDNQREKEWMLEQSRLMRAGATMAANMTQAPPTGSKPALVGPISKLNPANWAFRKGE